jgi:hypothetical protein
LKFIAPIRIAIPKWGREMAKWVKCTRKADEEVVHVNLDAVMLLKWNERDSFTLVLMPGGKQNAVRVLERPEDILAAGQERSTDKSTHSPKRER